MQGPGRHWQGAVTGQGRIHDTTPEPWPRNSTDFVKSQSCAALRCSASYAPHLIWPALAFRSRRSGVEPIRLTRWARPTQNRKIGGAARPLMHLAEETLNVPLFAAATRRELFELRRNRVIPRS